MTDKKEIVREEESQPTGAFRKLMTGNKGLALSFAVALAVSQAGCAPRSFSPAPNSTVLEKEPADEAEREWKEEEVSSYGTGYGYVHSPFIYLGGLASTRRATWTTPSAKQTVGGYTVFRGSSIGG